MPFDPPTDMLAGLRIVIIEEHTSGIDYGLLTFPDMDYPSFRLANLMPPIGDRFSQRRPDTARPSPSQRTATSRGGGRSSPGTFHASSSGFGSAHAPFCGSVPPPSRSDTEANDPMRLPPSISEATGGVNPILLGVRFPYEIPYGSMHSSHLPMRVPRPNRNLPITHVTEVPAGYVQDIIDLVDTMSRTFSNHLSECDSSEESRRRARR